ncbi:MAG: FAD-dependent oxidoreductase, partial [Planctomycetota bacterium]
PDRESHGVFLEPEGLRTDWVYCNGISSSLPADVQNVIVRTMPGCERAEILRYGYAVEYDTVRPHQINATGETRSVARLFLAGQINGTSGYEEAAAQGVVAGVNAVRSVRGQPSWELGRDEAYIGVLMDDLVSKTPVEPYRMFTSRAEHRLLLRADNAADRLTPVAEALGLLATTDLGRARSERFARRRREIAAIDQAIDGARLAQQPLDTAIRRSDFTPADLRAALPEIDASDASVFTVMTDRRYEAYVARQRAEIRRHAAMERRRVPAWIDYGLVEGLRAEARAALAKFRPETFGRAGRLEGVTPADVSILLVHARRGPAGRPAGAAAG